MPSLRFYACAFLLLALAVPAHGQDKAIAGVTVAYPGAIGVLWQPFDRLAIRPDISFSVGDMSGESGVSTDSTGIATNISVLLYLQPRAPFRMYISPRYTFGRTTVTSTSTLDPPAFPLPAFDTPAMTSTTRERDHSVSGLIGAEYRAAARFGLFAEAGVRYARTTMTGSGTVLGVETLRQSTGWRAGSTAGVGAMLLF